MAKQWQLINSAELNKAEVYKMEAHNAGMIKGIPWQVCKKCGLVYLRNDISKLAIRLGCNHELHQEFKQWHKKK